MRQQQNLDSYRNSITTFLNHISFAHEQYRNGQYKLKKDQREFIAESAYLKIYISWETFLENSFIDYLLGEASITNKRPAKWANPLDSLHANNILKGVQKFVDWSNPEVVRRLSKVYFHEGYVFNSELSAINNDLLDMKKIRNSAAHVSSSTSNELDALSTRLLGRPCTGFSAYKLLFSTNPNNAPATFIDDYIAKLDITAEAIANG